MDKYKIIIVSALILSLISIGLGVKSTMDITEGEWVCIAQKCVRYIEGEEWVAQNCKPTGPNNEMICEFMIEDNVFNVPLSGIGNLSAMQSCGEYVCDSEVYVRRVS